MSDDDFSSGGGSFDSGGGDFNSSAGEGTGDSYSETTVESWGSRLKSAVVGVLFGLLLFVGAFPLLWWNEGRAVHTAQGLSELGHNVVSVAPDKALPANEGKPVHLCGETAVTEVLADPDFPVSATAVQLRRAVEMFQWKEEEHTQKRKRVGGSEETTKTWSYHTRWADQVIDSSRFKKAAEHRNPPAMRFPGRVQAAKVVQVGAFRLPPELIAQVQNFEPLTLDAKRLAELSDEIKRSLKVEGDVLCVAADAQGPPPDPSSPRIGDLRIRFEVARPGPVSVIARQVGDSFQSWPSKAGTSIERLEAGRLTAAEMVGHMEAENNLFTWILRLVGLLAMTFGLVLLLNPLAVLGDVLPILGDILRFGTFLASALVAGCLSLLTIALAWLAYRPLWAVVLAALAVGLIVLLRKLVRAKKAAQPAV